MISVDSKVVNVFLNMGFRILDYFSTICKSCRKRCSNFCPLNHRCPLG